MQHYGGNVTGNGGWVTTRQAARALGVIPRQVRNYIAAGDLEGRKEGKGVNERWLVSISSVDALRQKPSLKLLIATTRVRDGKLRIFREKAITRDVILASTCLPLLHHAVTIEGEAYWDGGYAANPPLMPLVTATRATEALVVQIIPSVGADMPTTSPENPDRNS